MNLDFNTQGTEGYWVSCEHEGARIVFKRDKRGALRFREYCDKCGNYTEYSYSGCGLKKAYEKYGIERVWAARNSSEIELRPKRPDYKSYMASAAWYAKRAAVIARSGGFCEITGCGNKATQAHHLTYNNLGNEPLDELLAVCAECHREIHDEP